MQLKQSSVKRGGLTTSHWSGQTTNISADVTVAGLDFNFYLPSKGGGTTQIRLSLAFSDLESLLKVVAADNPKFAGALAVSTQIAVAALLKHASTGSGDA